MVSGFLVAMRRRAPARAPQNTPRVSILKPLAGIDDELDENLSSFATLDYPDYEIVLGVASVDDGAYPVARKFVERVGHERARLIITDPDAATNPKVAQLLALERAATGEVVVVSDSNVRVTPRYLDPLLAELSSPGVGTVSNVVAGTGERTLGAAMENLQLGAIIAPGIVASAFVLGKTITLGKSVAMWRRPSRTYRRVRARRASSVGRSHAGTGIRAGRLPGARVALAGGEPERGLHARANDRAPHALGADQARPLAGGVRDRAGSVARRDHHVGVSGLTDETVLPRAPVGRGLFRSDAP